MLFAVHISTTLVCVVNVLRMDKHRICLICQVMILEGMWLLRCSDAFFQIISLICCNVYTSKECYVILLVLRFVILPNWYYNTILRTQVIIFFF